MTDYLEALLDEEEEPDAPLIVQNKMVGLERPARTWPRAVLKPKARGFRGPQAEETASGPDAVWSGDSPDLAPQERPEPFGDPDPDRPPWLPPAAQAKPVSEDLYEALTKARRAVQMVHQNPASVTVPIPAEGTAAPALDLLGLDQAMERDARRYDGGFTLY